MIITEPHDTPPLPGVGLGRQLTPGIRYDVATNLNNSAISFRSTSKQSGYRAGKVVDYDHQVHLVNCVFRVLPSGLRRLREDGIKNVHAFVRGDLVSVDPKLRTKYVLDWWLVRYLPFEYDHFFVHETGQPIYWCNEAILIDRSLYVR